MSELKSKYIVGHIGRAIGARIVIVASTKITIETGGVSKGPGLLVLQDRHYRFQNLGWGQDFETMSHNNKEKIRMSIFGLCKKGVMNKSPFHPGGGATECIKS
jgi:hypothetical protein